MKTLASVLGTTLRTLSFPGKYWHRKHIWDPMLTVTIVSSQDHRSQQFYQIRGERCGFCCCFYWPGKHTFCCDPVPRKGNVSWNLKCFSGLRPGPALQWVLYNPLLPGIPAGLAFSSGCVRWALAMQKAFIPIFAPYWTLTSWFVFL